MSEQVLISFITAIASVVGSMIGTSSLVNWRLNKLEEKVDKHNSYSDKIAEQTQNIALIKQDIGYIKQLISK